MSAKPKLPARAKPTPARPRQRSVRAPLAPLAATCLLAAAALAAYWPILHHGFFAEWDDPDYVTANQHVQAGLTAQSIAWAFRATDFANWFPLTWLSHMLDCQLFGLDPLGHHLTSLILHLANCLLLFAVLRRMTGEAWPACLVAGLFALHPLRVESVAWVAERKDLLSGLFFFLTLLAYSRYAECQAESKVQSPRFKAAAPALRTRSLLWYGLALVLFALGLMAKPMLVSLPLVLLLIDYWPLRRVGQASGPRAWRRLLVEKVPFLALSAASSIVTFLVQTKAGTVAAVTAVPLSARLANVSVSYIAYLEKALVPVGLSPLYRFSFHLPAWQVAGSALLLVLATGAAFWGGRRHRYLVTGWLWYVVTVLPVSGLVQVGGQAMADRYTYLPLIGIAIMAVWGFRDLIEGLAASAGSGVQGAGEASRLPPRGLWRFLGLGRDARPTTLARLQFGVSGAILLCLAVATRHYVGYWRDSFTLFSRALTVNEANDTAHFNVGLWLATKEGKPREAADHFRRAVQLNAHHAPSRYSLGLCLAQLGDLAGAAQAYREALAVDPAYAFAHHNLAILLEREGEWPAALEQYEAALKASPQDGVMRQNLANAHNKFGAALKQQGDLKAAEAQFLAATGVEPGHTIARANLAQTFFDEGRYAEAWQAVELCRRYGGSPPPSLLTNLSLRLPQPRPQP